MTYEEFVKALLEEVQEKLKGIAKAELSARMQNNSVTLISMTLRGEGDAITPNIYLDSYYEKYHNNILLSALADEILSIYYEKKYVLPDFKNFSFEWEKRKEDIFYKVVNYNKNRNLLESTPHVRFLDLAVIFCCLVCYGKSKIGSIRITNEHKQKWNISTEDLMQAAEQNTPRLFPAVIQELSEVVSEMFDGGDETCQSKYGKDFLIPEDFPQLYVISNERNLNGASVILYPHLLQEFADQLESDLYILPSSIHEVILAVVKEPLEQESLKESVQEINRLFVIPEEILSDRVYYYSRDNHTIEA